jgi:uncharacterized membrane protein
MAKRLLVVTPFALLAALLHGECPAKSYTVEAIEIEARVTPQGIMHVTERIRFEFVGRFSFAYREIPLGPGEELSDVILSENGRVYDLSAGGAPGTFSTASSGSRTRVTWFYRAEDESRTFDLSYAATGVVRRFADVTEIYHKFVGEEWEASIGRVSVEMFLPESIDRAAIRAWAHGPLHGEVAVREGPPVVALTVSPLPARTFWEARILCPSEAFEALPFASAEPRLKAILSEEAAWAEEANRARRESQVRAEADAREQSTRAQRSRELLPVSIALSLAAVGTWMLFFFRHGRPHQVVARVAPGEVPSDHPPAAVSYLLYKTTTGPAVAATLLDLANRGYLEVRENVATVRGFLGKPKRRLDYRFDVLASAASDIRPFERDLLQFVVNEAGDKTGFSTLALQKAASRKSAHFRRFFRRWSAQVGEYCKDLRLYEPCPVRAMVANAAAGVAVLGAGVIIAIVTLSWVGVPPIIAGGIQAIFTVFLTRRTIEGQRLASTWRAFRKHLRALGRGRGPVRLASPEWGRYLAAAVLFGLHRKVMPNLSLEGAMERGAYPVWFYGVLEADGDGGVSGVITGLSSMVDAVSTTASSAAGMGGGASAGGGGGSGGGGGGAG